MDDLFPLSNIRNVLLINGKDVIRGKLLYFAVTQMISTLSLFITYAAHSVFNIGAKLRDRASSLNKTHSV